MSNYATIMTSIALSTNHLTRNANVGVTGMGLCVRKVDNSADKKIIQPALTLSGYPEFVEGSSNTATARNTTKYNYDAVVINE